MNITWSIIYLQWFPSLELRSHFAMAARRKEKKDKEKEKDKDKEKETCRHIRHWMQ